MTTRKATQPPLAWDTARRLNSAIRRADLRYSDERSDKVYKIAVEERLGRVYVVYAFGRRTAQQFQTGEHEFATPSDAFAFYDEQVRAKFTKGYRFRSDVEVEKGPIPAGRPRQIKVAIGNGRLRAIRRVHTVIWPGGKTEGVTGTPAGIAAMLGRRLSKELRVVDSSTQAEYTVTVSVSIK